MILMLRRLEITGCRRAKLNTPDYRVALKTPAIYEKIITWQNLYVFLSILIGIITLHIPNIGYFPYLRT